MARVNIRTIVIHGFIAAFFLLISAVVFRIPQDAFIAGGDFYQLLHPQENSARYFYAWMNQQEGQGVLSKTSIAFPFYSLLWVLGSLGWSTGALASVYLFLILYGSFLSAFFSLPLFFPKIRGDIRLGGALVYALNNVTVMIFTYPWGFSHHFLFYIFLPPLVALFLRILLDPRGLRSYFPAFVFVFILSTPAYNNITFLFLLMLVQFLFFSSLVVLKNIRLSGVTLLRLFLMGLVYIFFTCWLFISIYIDAPDIVGDVSHGKGLGGDLVNWILATSSNFTQTFLFALDRYRFPIFSGGWSVMLSAAYFVIIFFLARSAFHQESRAKTDRSVILSAFMLLLLLTFLSVRAYGPFSEIALWIYQLPFFSGFRSPEKIFSVFPLVYVIIVCGLLGIIHATRRVVIGIFALLLLIPLPFYTGGIQKAMQGEDGATYRYIITIPEEYNRVRTTINAEPRLGSVISLPYSVVNSLNWSNYPKWHYVGADVLHLLYNKYYIPANSYDHLTLSTRLSFKEFNEEGGDPSELLLLIQKFSGMFVFFHKDIDATWIRDSDHLQDSLRALDQAGELSLVESNDFFDLYHVAEKNVVPLIDAQTKGIFQKINPSKYRIQMTIREPVMLKFHQSYSPLWQFYVEPSYSKSSCETPLQFSGRPWQECPEDRRFFEGEEFSYFWKKPLFTETHELDQDYANSWIIDPAVILRDAPAAAIQKNADGSITFNLVLYFKPQSLFYFGMVMSGIGLLVSGGFLFYRAMKRHQHERTA